MAISFYRVMEPHGSRARATKSAFGILCAAYILLAALSIATASTSPKSIGEAAAAAQTRTPDLGFQQEKEPEAMRLRLTHAKAHAPPDAKLPTLRDLVHHDRHRLATFSESRRGALEVDCDDDHRHNRRSPGSQRNGHRRKRRGRSSGRATHKRRAEVGTPLTSNAPAGQAQYVVDFEFGTPPQKSLLIVDTGSDLLWTKCLYRSSHRKETEGYFHADASSSFSPIKCRTEACRYMPTSGCSSRLRGLCNYNYTYADGSVAEGILSYDTVTMKGVAIQNVAFGCTDVAQGNSFSASQGVLGLGADFVSFSSQVGSQYGSKFSYCFVDQLTHPTASNFLVFGHRRLPEAERKQIQSTPLRTNPQLPTFYYLQIEGLFVGGKRLPIPDNVWRIGSDGGGGTVIDSGTSLSFLLEPAFGVLYRAFDHLLPYPRVDFDPFPLCFNNTGVKHPYPGLAIVFEGGSCFEPPAHNYIIETYEGSDVSCLAFLEASGPLASNTIGNVLQQNFVVEYDRGSSKLRFVRTDCSKS